MSRYLNISNGNPCQDWSIDELEEHWNEIEPMKRAPQDLIIG